MHVEDLPQDGWAVRDEGRKTKEGMPQDYFFVWTENFNSFQFQKVISSQLNLNKNYLC